MCKIITTNFHGKRQFTHEENSTLAQYAHNYGALGMTVYMSLRAIMKTDKTITPQDAINQFEYETRKEP